MEALQCPLMTQSGHSQPLPGHQSLPIPLLVLGVGDEAARFHQSHCGFSGRVATDGACAAGRAHTAARDHRGLSGEGPETKARITAFLQKLKHLGWDEGRNLQIEMRESAGNAAAARKYAAELVAFAPDVILAVGGSTVPPLLEATHTAPIVFTIASDPVGNGLVDSLAEPGGNATGFMSFEYSLCGKWLELLKEIAPSVTRAAVLRDPALPAGVGQFDVIQIFAPPLGLNVSAINVRDAREIERGVAKFARLPNGGLVVTASPGSVIHRDLIVALADRHKLPTVYWDGTAVSNGGLPFHCPPFHVT